MARFTDRVLTENNYKCKIYGRTIPSMGYHLCHTKEGLVVVCCDCLDKRKRGCV